LAEKERIFVAPNAFLYHDKKNYTIEVELPGADKKDIKVEAGENGLETISSMPAAGHFLTP
jgi:HSP20 family molecular chaperone IbpA